MHTLRTVAALAGLASLLVGCGGDGTARPDAGDNPLIDADTNSTGNPDAEVPVEFAELELRVSPENPIPEHDFNLYIRAADTEGRLFRDYEGSVSVTASTGELLGATDSQQLTEGTAFLTLRLDEELEDVTLTVTDDDSSVSYTAEPFDVFFEGEPGEADDVLINEVNWYGPAANGAGTQDVWIELRNVSDKTLNVSQWRFEGAGIEGRDVFIFSKTVMEPDDYLLIGNFDVGSLDGVPNVQAHVTKIPLDLADEGAQIVFKDVEGTIIDSTPEATGGWPAGLADFTISYFLSMERRDEITGGGYGDGTDASQWYTWNAAAGVETTNPAFTDVGTPGAPNSDPSPSFSLPLETSFEDAEPRVEFVSTDEDARGRRSPPDGVAPRSGNRIFSTASLETSISARSVRTVDCLELDGGNDVRVVFHAMESEANDNDRGNTELIRARPAIEWYTDPACETPHATPQNQASPFTLPVGEYLEIPFQAPPPSGATHLKVRIDAQKGTADTEDLWAADDLSIEQVEAATSPTARRGGSGR